MSPGVMPAISSPLTATLPDVTGIRPVSASANSLCPFPDTPATPTISPARTSKDTPLTAGSPISLLQ